MTDTTLVELQTSVRDLIGVVGRDRAEAAAIQAEASAQAAEANATASATGAAEAEASAQAAATSAANAAQVVDGINAVQAAVEASAVQATNAENAAEGHKQDAYQYKLDAEAAADNVATGAPGEGWARSSLAQDVRDSLARADTALQTVPKATATAPGSVQLTGDLGGTWDAPTVPGLADKVDNSQVTSNSDPNTVALRGSQGQVAVGLEPPYTTSATSKDYVDSQVAALQAQVTALQNELAECVKSSTVRYIVEGTGANGNTLYVEV